MRSTESLFGPDVDADQPRRPPREARPGFVVAFVVEAEPVDDRTVLAQPEQSGARVAGLRTRRQRSDLDKAETEPQHRARNLGVLVESRGEPERVRKR